MGASGTALNDEMVMPFLMSVLPRSSSVIPSPCRTIARSGNAAPACETRYAGPVSEAFKTGVTAVPVPTTEAAGHDAGFAANVASGHAFCSVVSLEGSCLGRLTLTLAMFAWPGAEVTLTCSAAPFALLVLASVSTVNLGVNGSVTQLATWKRDDTGTIAPSVEAIVPVMDVGRHEVGLNVKPGRSIVRSTRRRRTGMPSTNVGKASDCAVTCASRGSMCSELRTSTVPRSKGPATAGTTTARPYGPPAYGP